MKIIFILFASIFACHPTKIESVHKYHIETVVDIIISPGGVRTSGYVYAVTDSGTHIQMYKYSTEGNNPFKVGDILRYKTNTHYNSSRKTYLGKVN